MYSNAFYFSRRYSGHRVSSINASNTCVNTSLFLSTSKPIVHCRFLCVPLILHLGVVCLCKFAGDASLIVVNVPRVERKMVRYVVEHPLIADSLSARSPSCRHRVFVERAVTEREI